MLGKYSKVVVTGGAGFIGSHTAERFLNAGMHVTILDNLETGSIRNIDHLREKENFLFVNGDVRSHHLAEEVVKDADAVVHLAGLISAPESFERPNLYNDVNIAGTLNMLKASLTSNVERFVYASSCAVYGDPTSVPVDESQPLHPNSPYAVSKLSAEFYVRLFFEVFRLKTVCLRYFNVYGPRQAKNEYSGVITSFVRCLRENHPLVIFGDGEQTRDFISVRDIVDANVLALTNDDAVGEVFNIGTGLATTVNQLAMAILETTGKSGDLNIVHSEARKGDIRESVADISKAKQKLRFVPQVALVAGLQELAKASLRKQARGVE